ncbi:putative quinol monooxygenase [Motiliproteus sp. MSK22-1]|uniref:putative quinol monooxygenase n=1 Tax=Motiliproteus sp. MSK22-1 TaxID=1897630 RepID=UPI0009758614|nr:putative quinol monooxygenase [Motiliproteus sp. MSK22-1]OMH38042.1 hypothetical protein BGP75_07095 [Motiliproteus sp. MSK22-1]
MSKLWISAGIEMQDGKNIEQALKALKQLAKVTLQEPSCFQFDVLQHQDNPKRFTLWECWQDESSLDAHFKTSHTRAYLAQNFTTVNYVERLSLVTIETSESFV